MRVGLPHEFCPSLFASERVGLSSDPSVTLLRRRARRRTLAVILPSDIHRHMRHASRIHAALVGTLSNRCADRRSTIVGNDANRHDRRARPNAANTPPPVGAGLGVCRERQHDAGEHKSEKNLFHRSTFLRAGNRRTRNANSPI